jgi:hypothetical protein
MALSHVMEDSSHKIRPEVDAGDVFFAYGEYKLD